MHIAKGDTVVVISGDDKGKSGKVLKVFPDTRRIIIEKVNFVKRHTKPTQKTTQGGIQEKEAPIHISNVMLVDPKTGHPTRAGIRRLEDGRRERFAKKSGESLPRAGR
jgi:large subunit ribosomal protein L24